MPEDFPIDSSSAQDLERLAEIERRLFETRNAEVEDLTIDDDDFSVHPKHEFHAPPIPEMRYEKQVDATIKSLREKGTSPIGIFWAVVVKDQIIFPFVGGFVWCIGTSAWSWYRTRGVVNSKTPKRTLGFFRGLHHGITQWTKSVYNTVSHTAE
ncbi:hypothetical protein BY458DRAFT_538328 [Sporodiniella umbellata]|nr:hypothetical protein BY458DRAFT_538328 [Sporodiniella umbellata]